MNECYCDILAGSNSYCNTQPKALPFKPLKSPKIFQIQKLNKLHINSWNLFLENITTNSECIIIYFYIIYIVHLTKNEISDYIICFPYRTTKYFELQFIFSSLTQNQFNFINQASNKRYKYDNWIYIPENQNNSKNEDEITKEIMEEDDIGEFSE